MAAIALQAGLRCISVLFSYPDGQWLSTPPPEGAGAEARALIGEMKSIDQIHLENEYIRLFVNAMPEVPCAPYGSVYLEGVVMGESTVKIAAIYRKYGMATEELADHIAVESEFLAWLHGQAQEDPDAELDFVYLLGHLRKWSEPFLREVERHDRLGCYRQSAGLTRSFLAQVSAH
jgi:TorA maturation chaperone TorD